MDMSTSPTLLGRLRLETQDQLAWEEFVERYGRKIYHWCRHWGLQSADAEDVTQDVLVKLARKMRSFAYDPSSSFRAWLKTATQQAWNDFWRGRNHQLEGISDPSLLAEFGTIQARENLAAHLRECFDKELLDEALARAQQRSQPVEWEIFQLTKVEGLGREETAQRLGVNLATLYIYSNRVFKRIKEERRKLEDGQTLAEPTG